MSALQGPRTNTSEILYGSGVIVSAMVEKKNQQHKRKGGYGGEEGGSRVSFLGQVQVHNAGASPGHLAWLHVIAHYDLPIFLESILYWSSHASQSICYLSRFALNVSI